MLKLTKNFKQLVHNFKESWEEFFMFIQSSYHPVERSDNKQSWKKYRLSASLLHFFLQSVWTDIP